jgi:U6 snRNA-associated Sm-like protein LSm8
MEQINLGLKIIRGDNVAVIGLIDESIESEIDYSKFSKLEPIKEVVH